MKWPVKQDALQSARRDSQRNDRTKWEYQCASCLEWFAGKDVGVDHIEECGSLDDMNKFIGTLFCEEGNLQVLCVGCHKVKTKESRNK